MVCVHCGAKTKVINSRSQKKSNHVWRRRQCLSCRAVFTTEEAVSYDNIWLVSDKTGSDTSFQPNKLLLSLYASCQHRETALVDATALTETVIQKLMLTYRDNNPTSAQTIAQICQVVLNRFDKAASVYYAAHHK